jgi:holo-[acyl-carrier protein] synthase
MVVGLGVDVFEVSRMEQALREGDPGFEHSLFTDDEIAYCRRQQDPAAHFAARFALKEAVFKALAVDHAAGVSWRSVELHVTPRATATVVLHSPLKELADARGIIRVFTSFSRAGGLVAASAVLES